MHISRILVATIIGAVLSTGLFLLIYALQSNALTGAFMLSGTPTASFLIWALPDAFMYWLLPEGGGLATVLMFTFSAWLQFLLVFSVLAHLFLRRRSNPAVKRKAPQAARPLP